MLADNRASEGRMVGLSRRGFLKSSGLGLAGLSLAGSAQAKLASGSSDERSVILLMLVGGPSQLETFDPKPEAPAEVRGPFGSIASALPGIRLSEYLPGLSQRMRRLTLIRSLHHKASPIHETGHQLIQTGRLARDGHDWPHLGAVAAQRLGPRGEAPPFVVLPWRIGSTGVGISQGQGAGFLGPRYEPFVLDADPLQPGFAKSSAFGDRGGWASKVLDLQRERPETRESYGETTFGQSCLLARRLVEAGSRFVVVNMYETVFGQPSWDAHGRHPFSTLADYRETVLPSFDWAFCALVDDLEARGRLDSTLVVATGEFGRSPKLNESGGRDHWPMVWSALLAGGGTNGGQVIGASDSWASEPIERPVHPSELAATIYQTLGIDPTATLSLPGAAPVALIESARPIEEVWA